MKILLIGLFFLSSYLNARGSVNNQQLTKFADLDHNGTVEKIVLERDNSGWCVCVFGDSLELRLPIEEASLNPIYINTSVSTFIVKDIDHDGEIEICVSWESPLFANRANLLVSILDNSTKKLSLKKFRYGTSKEFYDTLVSLGGLFYIDIEDASIYFLSGTIIFENADGEPFSYYKVTKYKWNSELKEYLFQGYHLLRDTEERLVKVGELPDKKDFLNILLLNKF